MSERRLGYLVAAACLALPRPAMAQSSASFPVDDAAASPSAVAPAPAPSYDPAPVPDPGPASSFGKPAPPGYGLPASPAPAAPPPATGQSFGPYQRPAGAPMPGYGEMDQGPLEDGRARHDHRHDGFYLRLAGGFGWASDGQSTDRPIPSTRDLPFQPAPYNGSMSGLAPGTEIAVGFTPLRGLVLGVAVDTATIVGGSASVDDPRTGDYEYRTSQFALFNAFGDFYFDPELGFHGQAGVGLATYVAGVGDPQLGPRAQAHTAIGFGLMFGGGYEFFVSRQWSLGALFRVLWGTTSGTDPKGVDWSHSTLVPGLMLSATYH